MYTVLFKTHISRARKKCLTPLSLATPHTASVHIKPITCVGCCSRYYISPFFFVPPIENALSLCKSSACAAVRARTLYGKALALLLLLSLTSPAVSAFLASLGPLYSSSSHVYASVCVCVKRPFTRSDKTRQSFIRRAIIYITFSFNAIIERGAQTTMALVIFN